MTNKVNNTTTTPVTAPVTAPITPYAPQVNPQLLLLKKLQQIQIEMRAPKDKHNDYGNYFYRYAEDILDTLKPLLVKYGCDLTIMDAVQEIGGRVYVKSTVTMIDLETGAHVSASAFAREAAVKKGMDDCQVTGSCSTYAKKYALQNLLLLTNAKMDDPDSGEWRKARAEALAEEYQLASQYGTPQQQAQAQRSVNVFQQDFMTPMQPAQQQRR